MWAPFRGCLPGKGGGVGGWGGGTGMIVGNSEKIEEPLGDTKP